MQIKKTAIVTVFVSAIFVSANFMVAKAYEPLVRIPGLPPAGPINLSQYIVGLYNFLLSIVGIVAVMMLIIGGMKYIAAAGNASVISDAKDTIWNAILGLLLALLSWVIVSTINPDVLYIKHPASSLIGNEFKNDLGVCGVYDGAVCTCKDGTTPFAVNQADCEDKCSNADACGTTKGFPCIGGISNNPIEGVCHCVDGNKNVVVNYGPAPADAKCNEVCSNPAWAVDGKYHGVNIVLRAGTSVDLMKTLTSGDAAIGLTQGDEYVFDLSQSYDCRYGFVHFALNFDGTPTDIGDAFSTLFCCETDGSCPDGWGWFCNAFPMFSCSGSQPAGLEDEPAPLEKYIFNDLGSNTIWVGVSLDDGACSEYTREFNIDVNAP